MHQAIEKCNTSCWNFHHPLENTIGKQRSSGIFSLHFSANMARSTSRQAPIHLERKWPEAACPSGDRAGWCVARGVAREAGWLEEQQDVATRAK